MAAVFYGLLAAVLQISGAFSIQYSEEQDSLTRPWLSHQPISRDYRRFGNFGKFRDFHDFHIDSRRRFTNTEQNLDYQLFPPSWLNHNKDSEKFLSSSRLGNALSSDSTITSSRSRLQMMKHLKTLPKESRKEQYPNPFLKYRPVVLNTSSLRSSKGVSDGMDSSDIGRPSILHKNDAEDSAFSTPALHLMISTDEVPNETPTVPGEKKAAEEWARNDTLGEKDTRKNSTVLEGQEVDLEGKASNNETILEEEEEKDSKEETTVTTKTPSVHEKSPDLDGSTDFEINNHTLVGKETNETKSVQDEKEETEDAEDETSKPATEVISKNTSENSSATEDTLSTNSRITKEVPTKEVPSNSPGDTAETVHGSSTSILNETALPVKDSTSEATHIPSSNSSPSEVVSSTTKIPVSTKGITDAPVSPTLSSEITDASSKDPSPESTESKSSKTEYVTDETTVGPEHVIDIPSIRKAKIVISAVFLVIGLIAVAVLAVFMFRERRKAVKYDQLNLIP